MDALYHMFGIFPVSMLDCQIVLMNSPRRRQHNFVMGLRKAMDLTRTVSEAEKMRFARIKDAGKRLFAPELGGSYDVWEKRPIAPALLNYMSTDIVVLLPWFEEQLRESRMMLPTLMKKTEDRARKNGRCSCSCDWTRHGYPRFLGKICA